jgi:hypothetical protein
MAFMLTRMVAEDLIWSTFCEIRDTLFPSLSIEMITAFCGEDTHAGGNRTGGAGYNLSFAQAVGSTGRWAGQQD